MTGGEIQGMKSRLATKVAKQPRVVTGIFRYKRRTDFHKMQNNSAAVDHDGSPTGLKTERKSRHPSRLAEEEAITKATLRRKTRPLPLQRYASKRKVILIDPPAVGAQPPPGAKRPRIRPATIPAASAKSLTGAKRPKVQPAANKEQSVKRSTGVVLPTPGVTQKEPIVGRSLPCLDTSPKITGAGSPPAGKIFFSAQTLTGARRLSSSAQPLTGVRRLSTSAQTLKSTKRLSTATQSHSGVKCQNRTSPILGASRSFLKIPCFSLEKSTTSSAWHNSTPLSSNGSSSPYNWVIPSLTTPEQLSPFRVISEGTQAGVAWKNYKDAATQTLGKEISKENQRTIATQTKSRGGRQEKERRERAENFRRERRDRRGYRY